MQNICVYVDMCTFAYRIERHLSMCISVNVCVYLWCWSIRDLPVREFCPVTIKLRLRNDSNQINWNPWISLLMTKIFDTIFNLWLLAHLTVVIYHWYTLNVPRRAQKFARWAGCIKACMQIKSLREPKCSKINNNLYLD